MSTAVAYPEEQYISTSVSKRILAWANAAHRRRRISIISGPPGIGKTESILKFAKENPGGVRVIKIARKNASPTLVLRDVAEVLKGLVPGNESYWVPNGMYELRHSIFSSLCGWAGFDPARARLSRPPEGSFGLLTLVFDEAQNLSRDAIEVLRFWNDADSCYAPAPLGLVFVGNSEFMLKSEPGRPSVLSQAVADRAIYSEVLEYNDIEDDDLARYAEARGVTDQGALEAILTFYRPQRGEPGVRSLRRLRDAVDGAIREAGDEEITAPLLRRHLR